MGSRKTGRGVENWDEFVRRAQVYIDTGRLDSEEISPNPPKDGV